MQRIFSRSVRRNFLACLSVVVALFIGLGFNPVQANQNLGHIDPVAVQLQQSSEGPKTLTVWVPNEGFYSGGSLQSASQNSQVKIWDQTAGQQLSLAYQHNDGGGNVYMATNVHGHTFSAPEIGGVYVDAHAGALVCAGRGNLVPNQGCNYPWAR